MFELNISNGLNHVIEAERLGFVLVLAANCIAELGSNLKINKAYSHTLANVHFVVPTK